MKLNTKYIPIISFWVLSICIAIISRNIPFFWDSVTSGSKLASLLYYDGLFNWHFPELIDNGHPPFLPFISALSWKALGRELWVSHAIMAPFIFGFLYQLWTLIKHITTNTKYQIAGLILVIADPNITAHLIHVNYEIILLFFFLLATNSILNNKSNWTIIALSLLGIVNLRGMLLCFGVFLFHFFYSLLEHKSAKTFFNKKNIRIYLLGAIPSVVFLLWSILTKNRIEPSSESGWRTAFEFTDSLSSLLFKVLSIAHKFVDFGRIGVIILVFVAITFKLVPFAKKEKKLALLSVFSILPILTITLTRQMSAMHNYFLPSFVALNLLAFTILLNIKKHKIKFYSILLVLLITGNFWIYPYRIAQGWNSSLASLPYFDLRKEMLQYIADNNIPTDSVATFFPNRGVVDEIDLSGDTRKLQAFTWDNKYVFWSNVYNLTNNEFEILYHYYDDISWFHKNRIHIVLFERKDNNPYINYKQ